MSWTVFWQIFILVPWVMLWIGVPLTSIKKVTNNFLGSSGS